MSNQFWDQVSKGHKHFVDHLPQSKQKRLIDRFQAHGIGQLNTAEIQTTLDWGCGGGLLAKIASTFSEVILLDISEDSLQEALRYLAPLEPRTILFDSEVDPELQVDLLICYDVIHHFSSYEYWQQIAKTWIDIGPRFISMHAKIGVETNSAENYQEEYLNGLILTQEDFIYPFENYRLHHWAEQSQRKQTMINAARPPKVWHHGFAVLERK